MRFLKSKKLNSYYILFGDNDVFKRDFIDEVKALLKNEINETTIFSFDVADKENPVSVEDIIEKIKTPSFFSPRNIVIVKEFHKFLKDDLKKLFLFLNEMPEFANLIMMSSIDRNEFKQTVLDNIPDEYIFNFSNVNVSDTRLWIKEYLNSYGKTIDEEIIQYIIEELNTNTSLIKNEIEKILLWIGDKDNISKDDFNMMRSGDKEYNIWTLTDAIGFKNEKLAFTILEKIFDDFEPELILGAIFQTIRKIYTVRYYIYKNNEKKAMEAAHYNPRALFVIKKQIANFLEVPFVEILDIMMETDRKIKKSGLFDAKIAIYIMLGKIFLRLNKK